ncbi:cupin domain-containing protein [Mycolicibacterium monacense]|uniref:Cupin n=4 Tax=Mycobacteriaceae TaxID=1762 RepID=A0AAD1IQB9_MYCMB|nr:cupin domain-containing protein [Mycolicibacterium monacense]MDA4101136.1 cupin [Mycolicibacterium monacense DSM 44395]OBF57872.1 cupin [Mycolicibacterium monacense]ORB13373.1 cupin [Mycolicibacterium monacense DSM 44395]QHP87909.1 cupin domain-containing protein [Mycolicibacterium monacense DSM 44395]BBZ58894.1 cupin [Mycolicibacterium monacense]
MDVHRGWGVVPAAVIGLAVLPGSAAATPAEGDVVRTDLAKGETDQPVSITTAPGERSSLLVQDLQMRPGSSSGWHTHPGPEHSVITGGTVELQTAADCAVVPYGAGQAVFIPAGLAHRVANTAPHDAHVVATYTVPTGAPARGDSPDVCRK